MSGQLVLAPYLLFYLGQGVGCIAERAFYRSTGRRVRGWWGRAWMCAVLLSAGWPMVNEYYRMGWVGMMRGPLHLAASSPGAWLAYTLGAGPHPTSVSIGTQI